MLIVENIPDAVKGLSHLLNNCERLLIEKDQDILSLRQLLVETDSNIEETEYEKYRLSIQ